MKKKSITEAIQEVKADALAGPVESGKALAVKLKGTAGAETKVRDVVAFGGHANIVKKPIAEQKKWEQRPYLREWFKENPDVNTVTHTTSHTTNEIYEHAVAKMQELIAEGHPNMFRAKDFAVAFQTMGPAWQDICRNAMKKLAKEGKVEIHAETHGKVVRYQYELKELPETPK